MLDSLDAAAVRQWCAAGLAGLRQHQAELNALNVYPWADGDTGTNLVATLSSAWQALEAEPDPAEPEPEPVHRARVLRQLALGGLSGAHGNSGVIVAHILRVTADALATAPVVRGRALAEALTAAAKAAYGAVADPVEGTVLSVATGAALAATQVDSDELAAVVRAAAEGAATALARTPEQLPALARAGVVDAGGCGLLVLLDALVDVVTGREPDPAPLPWVPQDEALLVAAREAGSSEFSYEVQYRLVASEEAIEPLRQSLAGLGDSLVVVGTGQRPGQAEQTWNIHVHVNDAGAAIEAGVLAGRPYQISVTRFEDHPEPAGTRSTAAVRTGADGEERAVLVIAAGVGLAALFQAEGVGVVDGGPTNSPGHDEVLAAIRATGAGRVVLLPNDTHAHAVAQTAADAARGEGIRVGVVPTRSPVQALAAIAVRDPARRFHDEVIAMAEAAGACRHASVTIALWPALTVAGRCETGDVLALIEGEVNLIGAHLRETSITLLDRMLAGGGELVTLLVGAEAPPDLGEELTRHLAERWPFAEIQVYAGGQPHYPLLVGVE